MKKFATFLVMICTATASAAPSPYLLKLCERASDRYSYTAEYFGSFIVKIVDTTKPKSQKREEALKGYKQGIEEIQSQEFEKLRREADKAVADGADYMDARTWRTMMEAGFLSAIAVSAKEPGRSRLYYKNQMEENCVRDSR